jgi:hypothetical protein
MAKQAGLTFLPEVSGQERPDVNVQTEEALQKLLDALEARKEKPMFDPVALSTVGAFMRPTRSGSGFEAIANAIEGYTGARQTQRERELEDAKQYLGVVSQMGEIERRKLRDRQFQTALGMGAPVAETEEITVTDKRTPRGPVVRGSETIAPPGLEGQMGIQIGRPDPSILTGKEFLRGAFREGKMDFTEATQKAAELDRKRYEVRENGIYDLRTGLFYPSPKGELVERQIFGSTYKVPQNIAMQLDHFQATGDRTNYERMANRALGREAARGAEARPGTRPGAPSGAPAGAPAGGVKSEAQKGEEKIRREKRAEEETKLDVEAEAALGSNSKSAREMFNAAQRLQKATAESPMVFGLLQSPTIGNAILSLIDEGIQAGNTTIRLGGLQSAILKSIPGVTKEDITNLERAYSALAEIELKYTQLYLKGQGQVTEGERLIVRKLAGTEKNTPEFLNTQAKLIQMRSQYDIDVIDTFRRLKDQNPDMTWTQFQRSPAYRSMEDDFNKQIAKEFDLEPAVPSRGRGTSKGDPFNLESFNQTLKERKGQ